jgi:hypothetical protein
VLIWQCRQLLGSRQIELHYAIGEYREDIETLFDFGMER